MCVCVCVCIIVRDMCACHCVGLTSLLADLGMCGREDYELVQVGIKHTHTHTYSYTHILAHTLTHTHNRVKTLNDLNWAT